VAGQVAAEVEDGLLGILAPQVLVGQFVGNHGHQAGVAGQGVEVGAGGRLVLVAGCGLAGGRHALPGQFGVDHGAGVRDGCRAGGGGGQEHQEHG